MFKEILLPVDLNDESSWRKALPVAVDLCKTYGCKLHVITVVPTFGMTLVAQFFPKDFEKKALKEAEARLKALTKGHVPAQISCQNIVAHGTVYEEIVKTRQQLGDKVDLIVMASHRPELEDYLIGPNAARVVRHSKVSILVVRE